MHTYIQHQMCQPLVQLNILLKAPIYTLQCLVHTHVVHILHLVCVYLDAAGCLTTPHHLSPHSLHHPLVLPLFRFFSVSNLFPLLFPIVYRVILGLYTSCLPEVV